MDLQHKTVMVTGGTSGIGLRVAQALLAQGATVLVCGRDQAALDRLHDESPTIETYACDLADLAALRALIAQLGPRIDVWVNNAGVFQEYDFLHPQLPFERLQSELQINFVAAALAMVELLPHLRARPAAAFVNITAGMVYVPLVLNPMYSASKAALHSFSLSMRAQLAGTPIRVIEVAPPMVATRLTEGMEGSRVAPGVVADAVVKALTSGPDNVLVGQTKGLVLMSRFLPKLIFNLLNKPALAALRRRE